MSKVNLFCLIVIGIIASSFYNVNCCKTLRSRRHQEKIAEQVNKEKGNAVLFSYDNAKTPDGDNHEAENIEALSDLMSGITLETSRKIKRNTPNFDNFPLEQDESKKSNKTTPQTLIATIADYDENNNPLSDKQKTKRNPLENDPTTVQKLRRARDKKYLCLCEETKCSTTDCLRKSSKENTEDDDNNSAEVLDSANIIQKTLNEPKKFNIPFANHVNFDQRVVIDGKTAELKAPPMYPVYANPQVYHYTPYTLAHPGLIYTGVTPLQQNYAPAAAYNQVPSPSPIPANLLKMWKNGVQNLMPLDNNVAKAPEYVPNYSTENKKNDVPDKEPSKVTTPRQVDNRLYAQNNPSVGNSNIEDLRPSYGYSTDFPYNQQPYTTEIVSAEDFNFITESSTETRQLQFGDPTTTNYAPNYQTTSQNQYPNENNPVKNSNAAYPNNHQNVPQYDYNGLPVSTSPSAVYTNSPIYDNNEYHSQEDLYNQPDSDELSIEIDRMTEDYRNNVPTMVSVPNDSDLRAYDPPQTQAPPKPYNRLRDFVIQPPSSYNIEKVNPPGEQQTNTEVYNNAAQRATTLEDVNNGYKNHFNPQRPATLRNAKGYKKNENVGVENDDRPSELDALFKGLEKIILNDASVSDTPQAQAIDERPSTTYENTYGNFDTTVVQNAVKKVLNNFVPGKSEDLLANYGTERSQELARKNAESLSPDIANTHVLKNLLNVPEVENMIVDTASSLINQVLGSPVDNDMIKDTLRNVMNEIPRPTTAPKNKRRIRIRIAKRVPRYEESSEREVFEKIKNIIEKSDLGEEVATHPLAQNLIVKTVKYSLDKEKGVADEATIRRVYNQLVKSKRPSGRPLIVQPKETTNNNDRETSQETYTTQDTGYQLAPEIPVTERRLQGGVWVERPKTWVGNTTPGKSALVEKRRKELEKQLDMLQQYNETVNDSTESVESPYDATTLKNNIGRKNDVSTRQALSKFYDNMGVTADPQNYPRGHNYQTKPIVTTLNYQNYRDPMYTTPQPDENRLNLLVDSTQSKNDASREPGYMGKLVPVNTDGGNVDNSNLVWIGDGVRLPLTTRKMPDGSIALTLSDEVCQMFSHKKCPCCLPGAGQGVIVRERRNDEHDFTGDGEKRYPTKLSGNYRVRRESGEVTTLKTFSNAIGKHEFNDEDYDQSVEDNSIRNGGGPYKYQRYAHEDRIISGRTRALGNMLQWVKDVVTEAQEKRQRQLISNGSKHKVLLF